MINQIILQGRCPLDFINFYRTELIYTQIDRFSKEIDIKWKTVINNYLNLYIDVNTIHVFTSIMEYDVELDNVFNRFFEMNNPNDIRCIDCKISSLIDSTTLLPVSKVYAGHKAICVIDFNKNNEQRIELPIIKEFHSKDSREVIIFNEFERSSK
ncbi:hypothetical protein [Paenibacillus rigui]|uniref:Uncharacterized protein n=1 Tax=Paenibacillus rigui TaxID=554312 RepID=A0A229UFX5_9BACL|nr:hypothetical protein [Paenibacillus rigui]OXM82284.1 hypothetical protein CF651_31745 [Paenibacillus rigui]